MNKLKTGLFLSELLILVSILVCCSLRLKIFCIVLVAVLVILEVLNIYLNRQISQVIHYCKIKSVLIAGQKFEEADKLTSQLTGIQKFILEDMKK